MEHLSNALGEPLTQDSSDTEHIHAMIRRMFVRSHEAICVPVHDREYDNPLTTEEKVILKIAARRDIQRYCLDFQAVIITTVIEDLMDKLVTDKFDTAQDSETFFHFCISFDNYIDHIARWVDTMLAPLDQEEGSPFTGLFMANTAYKHIVSTYQEKIVLYFLAKSSTVRMWHSYHASWAFEVAYSDRFMKVIKRLLSFYDEEDRIQKWERSYIRVVKEELRRALNVLPHDTELREFLTTVRAAWDQEWKLYTKLFDLPSYDKKEFKRIMLKSAHFHYVTRRGEANTSFFSVLDLMIADDRNFDPRLLADMFLILSHTDQCFINLIDQLKRALSVDARKKCFKKVEDILCEDIDAPEWNLPQMMDKYWRISLSYTSKWRDALRQSLREDQLEYIKKAFSEGVFHCIKKRAAIDSIEKIGNSCAEFLCGVEGPRQTRMRLELVIDFYRTIANQKMLARHAARKFIQIIDAGRGDSLRLIYQFCEHESVSTMSDELKGLIYWTKEAEQVCDRINPDDDSEEGTVQNTNATMKVSGSIYAEKYMPEYETNLLRKPEELVDIDRRFAALAHAQTNLRGEERLSVQNAQSVLRIRTKMFGSNKEPIRLILTVYQFSVLLCLQRKREMTVKDLYSTLKRTDVSGRTDEQLVRKVIKLVLMSLTQPYQLVKFFSGRSMLTSEEICPSKPEDISPGHYVVLNKELQTGCERLQLPRPDLKLSNLDEVEDDIQNVEEQAGRINPMVAIVAQRALFIRVRSKCATSATNLINEEETISEVYDRLKNFNLEMQTIRLALEILIQKGDIERHQEGGTNMLKFIDRASPE